MQRTILTIVSFILTFYSISQVTNPDAKKRYYLIHSSGNVIGEGVDNRTVIQEVSGGGEQLLNFIPDNQGFYNIKINGQEKYMALSGSWNTYFISDPSTNESKYAIEKVNNSIVRLKCKANNKYLGTDNLTPGSSVFSDKSGSDSKHYWYISEIAGKFPADTLRYLINPAASYTKEFEGWGVSLCWWASMCGKWSDSKIDEIIEWMVSPEGLNYRIFRYNIGGGDDPLNRNCTPHHMASGKGIRAEMEGFKLYENQPYDWSRDAAQRRIMLKIKEKRPDAIFEAFSNSPPYYMTFSGCCAGNTSATSNNLKPEYYDDFARYLVDVCKFYKDSFGIEFKTLEPFNEPVTNYWSANGGQEGCYFSTTAQINFLKVLSPVLKESGLKTIISASDETSTDQSVTSFKAYEQDKAVLDMIGQWNTHTYGANNKSRTTLRAMATAHNKTLWMSEVGEGGTGISGNLKLAQKLIDDIRFIKPEAWIDWQYVEENNDQWCTVKGNFSAQTYNRVKNYYVRQQFSKYIPQGYRFLNVFSNQSLAAISPGKDTLIIVLLNSADLKTNHHIDLSLVETINNGIKMTRTSENENNATLADYDLKDAVLRLTLKPKSIATLVIPITVKGFVNNDIKKNEPYLIASRATGMILQTKDNSVIVDNYVYESPGQIWKFIPQGSGYNITNLSGISLKDNGSYFLGASATTGIPGEIFSFENIGDDYYKIISLKSGLVFDLEGAQTNAGTKIGLYNYGTRNDAVTRQWVMFSPPNDNVEQPTEINTGYENKLIRILGGDGAVFIYKSLKEKISIKVFSLDGVNVVNQTMTESFKRINLRKGIYLVSANSSKSHNPTIDKVYVR